jgi:hypothetical protein
MTIKEIVKLACPTYKGRKMSLGSGPAPKHLDSYWDEGYRTYYFFVRIADKLVHPVHSNHPGFEASQPRYLVNDLPLGWALVCHHFTGTTQSVSVYYGTGADQYPVVRA